MASPVEHGYCRHTISSGTKRSVTMINLRMVFTGLCGFVPKHEINTHRNNNKLAAIMPFASMHRAALVVHKDFVLETGARQPESRGDLRLFYLEREEISISPPGGPDDVSIDWRDGELSPCPSGEEFRDFRYVARLERIKDGARKMEDLYVIGNGGAVVAGRVILQAGWVRTESVGTFRGSVIRWKMEPKAASDPRYEQALAEAVEVIRDGIPGDTISLLSRRLGKKDESLLAKLKPVGDRIEVFFKNLPPDQLTADPESGDVLRKPDDHFFHYYRLAGSTHARIPHPFSCATKEGAIESVDNPKCPPAQFVANAEI